MENAHFEPDSTPPATARALGDEWYMKAYGPPESRRKYYGQRLAGAMTKLRNVVIAIVVGACLGLGVAALRKPQPVRTPDLRASTEHAPAQATASWIAPPPAYVAPTTHTAREAAPAAISNPAELERIKTRNRRLEALVAVLRERKHPPEKRAAPDPSSLIGQ